MKLPAYSQFDQRWGNEIMAPSTSLMRQWGCLVTSVSMGISNFAIDMDPGVLCRKLVAVGGFDMWSNLLHEAIEKIDPNLVFFQRIYTTNSPSGAQKMLTGAAMNRIGRLLAMSQPVMLEVDNVGNDGRPDHWVVAREYKNGDFLINNPDGGVEQWFSQKYGDPAKKLFGYYAVIGPPISDTSGLGTALWKAAMVWKGKNVQTYSKEILDSLIE